MAVADAPGGNISPVGPADRVIDPLGGGDQANVEASFAQGMYVSIWPKIERCHNYVSVLLAAQEQLQETVDQLIAGSFLFLYVLVLRGLLTRSYPK